MSLHRSRITLLGSILALSLVALAAAPAPAHAKGDDSSAAREHYKRGTTLYDLGKYDDAIAEFQQAYEIKDEPVLLYNIAQAHRLNNHYGEALRFYRTYLRRSPQAKNREDVEQKIADMEALIQQQQKVVGAQPVEAVPPRGDRPATGGARSVDGSESRPSPQRTTEPHPATASTPRSSEPRPAPVEPRPAPVEPRPEVTTQPPPQPNEPAPDARATTETPATTTPVDSGSGARPGRGKLIGGIVIAVVGVAALGAGIAMGAMASGKADDVSKATVFNKDDESAGKTFNTVGIALDVTGGVLIAAGAVVAVLGATQKAEAPRSATLVPTVGRNYAGAALSLRF